MDEDERQEALMALENALDEAVGIAEALGLAGVRAALDGVLVEVFGF